MNKETFYALKMAIKFLIAIATAILGVFSTQGDE